MDPSTLKSVVKSVNFMSRQLLADCHAAPKGGLETAMSQYYTAMCAVTSPSIEQDPNTSKYEYQRVDKES